MKKHYILILVGVLLCIVTYIIVKTSKEKETIVKRNNTSTIPTKNTQITGKEYTRKIREDNAKGPGTTDKKVDPETPEEHKIKEKLVLELIHNGTYKDVKRAIDIIREETTGKVRYNMLYSLALLKNKEGSTSIS